MLESVKSEPVFLAKRIETLHFKKSLDPAGIGRIPKLWCGISTLFSFHINANITGVSDVEEQWFGLEKSLCSSLGETKQPALSLERSCPEEVALKRVK